MPKFAKRHYEAIAIAMQRSAPDTSPGHDRAGRQWRLCCEELAGAFERDNPQFKPQRFYVACLPGANVWRRS
jgi:hypothetical protein